MFWGTGTLKFKAGLEIPRFLKKVFGFLVFRLFKGFLNFLRFCVQRIKTGHKITTEKEHPIHHSPCHIGAYIVFYKFIIYL